jgi:hypothetical protein
MNRRGFLQTAGLGSTALALGAATNTEGHEWHSKPVPDGQTAFEILGRSDQVGPQVTHYGYLTHIYGLKDELLFADASGRTEATARFTFLAVTDLDSRHEHGNIITTTAPGELTIYFHENPGADFNTPASFADGKPIASYSTRYHNVLNVLAPNQGVTAASVELTQISASSFMLAGRRLRLGQPGLRARLTASGSGTRTQPNPVQASFLLGGSAVIVDI